MKTLPGIMPIKMKNEGFYDNHSQTQRAIINMTLPYVKEALLVVPLPKEKEPFVIVDYGCSEGGNSVYVVNAIIDNIRQREQNQHFNVIFNDLPQNNFNKLFENIYQGNLKDYGSVLTFASGQPFHSQVMPACTIHFGYSASAAHWLTHLPEHAVDSHIYLSGATEKEKGKLAEIAAKDWQNFLNARAEEMLPGARLVVTMAARLTGNANKDAMLKKIGDDDGKIFNSAKGPQETYTAQIIMDLINDIVQELMQEKKISQEQAKNICCPIYPRTLDEVLAPVMQSELKTKFIVEHAELVKIACPTFEKYLLSGDSETYARTTTEMFKAFMEPFLLYQLFGSRERRRSERLESDGQKIVDELFAHMQLRVKSKPEYYTFFPIHSLLVLARK